MTKRHPRPLTLHPLTFDEAMTDVLKVKPEARKQRTKEKVPDRGLRAKRSKNTNH